MEGHMRLSLSGKVVWVPSPLLRLHCDTKLNQSVPKTNEKRLTLLLQTFKTCCPGSDFAKLFVLGTHILCISWTHPWDSRLCRDLVPAEQCTTCSGTMGRALPTVPVSCQLCVPSVNDPGTLSGQLKIPKDSEDAAAGHKAGSDAHDREMGVSPSSPGYPCRRDDPTP